MIGGTAPPDPHRRSYAELSEAERWDWHARIYAFRRVIMGIDERSSPTDPDGFWFDQPRVDDETRRLLAKRRQQARNVAAEMGVTAREIVPERDEAAREEPPH